MVHVRHKGPARTDSHWPQVNFVVPSLAVFHQEWVVDKTYVADHEVDLSGNDTHQNGLGITHEIVVNLIDIGKLIPLRINLPEIRISFQSINLVT